jgi:hypothetical protein
VLDFLANLMPRPEWSNGGYSRRAAVGAKACSAAKLLTRDEARRIAANIATPASPLVAQSLAGPSAAILSV